MIKMIIDLYLWVKKKVIAKFKDELNGKIMTQLCDLTAKTYPFKLDDYDNTEYKKAKGTKNIY